MDGCFVRAAVSVCSGAVLVLAVAASIRGAASWAEAEVRASAPRTLGFVAKRKGAQAAPATRAIVGHWPMLAGRSSHSLDDELTIVAAISGRKRMAVCPESVRVVLGWRYHEARAGLRVAFRTGDLCRPPDLTALRPWSRRTDVRR